MKFNAVDYIMYSVSDLKKSIEFYEKTLGLKLTSSGDGWAEFLIGDTAFVLGTWSFDPKKVGCPNGMALAVDDIEATINELQKQGIKVEGDIWETPVCHGATFTDPDGNKIYLHSRKDGTFG